MIESKLFLVPSTCCRRTNSDQNIGRSRLGAGPAAAGAGAGAEAARIRLSAWSCWMDFTSSACRCLRPPPAAEAFGPRATPWSRGAGSGAAAV